MEIEVKSLKLVSKKQVVMQKVTYSLICAVRDGRVKKARELINSFGLSYSPAWSQGYVLLRDALMNNHTEVAKLLLTHSSKVNSRRSIDIPSNTPLHFAVKNGNLDIIKMILDKGGNIAAKNEYGKTPLHSAIKNKKTAVIELLLKHGGDVNTRDDIGVSLLHFAVEGGCLQIIEHLLKHGADVNAKDNNGRSPLHVAIEINCLQIIEHLLKHGADVNAKDNEGRSPLHVALEMRCFQIVEYLLKYGADVNCESTSLKCNAPLHVAVETESQAVIMLLLSRGANVDVKGEDSITPLHSAAKKGYTLIAETLLNHGACINSLTLKEGYTPLHFASELNNDEAVKLFLNRGADINASTKGHLSPLHIATKTKCKTVVILLLQHGAKVDNQDKDGKTVLHLAVDKGNLTIVKEVLKYSPDINNKSNRSSLKIAVHGYGEEYKKIVKALLEYGLIVHPPDANDPKLLYAAIEKGYVKIVEDLLKYGADVNTFEEGFTPLHGAFKNKQEEVAKLLISHEADINAKDKIGKTPILYAIDNKDFKITKLLLTNGANVKDSPELLCMAVKTGCIEIVEAFLQHEADINAQDENGKAPIFYAIKNTDLKITKLLLTNRANIKDSPDLLSIAVKKECIKMVEALLQYDADVNTSDEFGKTALYFTAVREGSFGFCTKKSNDHIKGHIAKLLLSRGANVNSQTKDGVTTLHTATKQEQETVVRLLLQYGAKVDDQDRDGKTILYLAAVNGNLTIVEDVLKYCPDINNKSNRSSLKIAVHGYGEEYKEIVKALLEYGLIVHPPDANDPKFLYAAIKKGYVKIVEDLLRYGADVNTFEEGFTPLHSAVKNKQEEVATLLISYKANINAEDKTGKTPIFYAIENADLKITKQLLTNGANVKDSPELLSIAIKGMH